MDDLDFLRGIKDGLTSLLRARIKAQLLPWVGTRGMADHVHNTLCGATKQPLNAKPQEIDNLKLEELANFLIHPKGQRTYEELVGSGEAGQHIKYRLEWIAKLEDAMDRALVDSDTALQRIFISACLHVAFAIEPNFADLQESKWMIERIRAYKPLFFEQQDPQTARAYVSEAETKARSYMVSQAVKIWGLDGVALRWKDCQRSPRKSLHLEDKMREGWDQWDLPAFRKLITANQKDGDHSYGDKLLGSRDGILGHTWRGVSQVLRNAQAHFAHGAVKIDGGQDADPSLASLASYEFAGNIYLYFLSRVRLDDTFGHEVSLLDRKMSEYFSGLIPSSADTQSPSAPITDESESASLDGEPELGPGPIGRVRGAGAVKTSVLAIGAIAIVWLCFPSWWSAPGGPSETGRTAFEKTVPSLVVADPASTSATTGGGDVSASPIRWVWSRRTVGGRESLKLHWEDRCWSMKQIAGENREESLATFATIQERFRPQAVQKCQLCEAIEADGTRSASGGLPVGVRMKEVPADYAQQIRGELRNWIWSKAVSRSDKEMMLHWKSCKGVGWMKAENQMKATASIEDLSMRHSALTIQFCPGCYRMEQEGHR